MNKSVSRLTKTARTASIVTVCATAAMITASTFAFAGPGKGSSPNGKPFQAIQDAIGDLESILDTEVATLQTKIADLQAQIAANDGDITTLNVRLDDLEADLLAALKAAILDLQEKIDTNALGITTNADGTTTNAVDIAALETKVDDLAAQLADELQAAILELEGEIAELQAQITANDADISTNVGDIATNEGAIAALDMELGGLIRDLRTTLNIRINGLNVRIGENTGDITALNADLAELQTQLDDVEQDLADRHANRTACDVDGEAIREVRDDGSVVCISALSTTIDNSTTNIDNSTTNIDNSTTITEEITVHEHITNEVHVHITNQVHEHITNNEIHEHITNVYVTKGRIQTAYVYGSPNTKLPWITAASAIATCPSGFELSGGGFWASSPLVTFAQSYPSTNGKTWIVVATNQDTFTTQNFEADAQCIRIVQ